MQALARRAALTPGQRDAAAEALAARTFPVALAPGQIVAGYHPVRGEIDPHPLMAALAGQGATLALPVIAGPALPLVFRAWSPQDPLIRGPFGILQPTLDAAVVTPDILLVPLAGFDRSGHRIGYGAGYYDRSFAQIRQLRHVVAIGLAFDVQEVDAVPSEPHDVALDFVLTDTSTFDFRR